MFKYANTTSQWEPTATVLKHAWITDIVDDNDIVSHLCLAKAGSTDIVLSYSFISTMVKWNTAKIPQKNPKQVVKQDKSIQMQYKRQTQMNLWQTFSLRLESWVQSRKPNKKYK